MGKTLTQLVFISWLKKKYVARESWKNYVAKKGCLHGLHHRLIMFCRIFLPGNETPYALRTICGGFRSEVSLSMALPQAMHPHGDGDSTKAEVPWLCFGAEKYAWGVPTYPNTIDILVFKDVETCWNIEKWHAVDSISEMTAVSGRRRKLCWVAAFEWPRRRHLGPHHAFWAPGVCQMCQVLPPDCKVFKWNRERWSDPRCSWSSSQHVTRVNSKASLLVPKKKLFLSHLNSLFYLLDIQTAFNEDWAKSKITYSGWQKSASDNGVIAYKLLSQTGNGDGIDRSKVSS